jgi:hypothetical protein
MRIGRWDIRFGEYGEKFIPPLLFGFVGRGNGALAVAAGRILFGWDFVLVSTWRNYPIFETWREWSFYLTGLSGKTYFVTVERLLSMGM